jgi:hypothetical protein
VRTGNRRTVAPVRALPDHVVAMVRRPVPEGCSVEPGTTPVVAFGDPATAEVATLGINPSWAEFCEGGALLTDSKRRLADAVSVGVEDLARATDGQVRQIVGACSRYFDHRPYWRWFGVLEKVLEMGCGASYLDGTACHLDLVQWATQPVWKDLTPGVRAELLADGVPHLRAQLKSDNIRLVLLNGRQVLKQVAAVGLVDLQEVGTLAYSPTRQTRLYRGVEAGVQFLGWSANLQSGFGTNSHAFLAELGQWVKEQWHTGGPGGTTASLHHGTRLSGVDDLRERLRAWLLTTDEPTIGDVGTFGGKPWLHFDVRGREVVLNADTKRAAVREFLAHPAAVLQVVANRRGVVNKVVFRPDGEPTPGWYAYTLEPLPSPVLL